MPSFWLGILSVILFSVTLGWLPPAGYVPISQGLWPWFSALIQPAIVLALFQIGFLARITRSAMLDVLDQDFIRTARAKGVDEWRTITKHAFRNTLIPVVTVTGIIISLLIGGSVVVEQVFALPGIGRLIVQGILARDYPLVQGTMLIFGFSFVADQHPRRHHLHAGRSAGALWLTSSPHPRPSTCSSIRGSATGCCASWQTTVRSGSASSSSAVMVLAALLRAAHRAV